MEIEDLLQILEIESVSDFSFFEHYAELVESEEDIPIEIIGQLFDDIDNDVLTELTEGYFEDVLKYIPDDAIDFYTLLSTIGQTLTSLAANPDIENSTPYTEEFYKFRSWYTFDSEVHCIQVSDKNEIECTISQALTLYRLENLNDEVYEYDFSDCLDYPMDEYIVNLADLSGDEINDEDSFDDVDDKL